MLVVMKNDATTDQINRVVKSIEEMGYQARPMPGQRMPSAPPNSATAGSHERTDAGSSTASVPAMYGGLDTTSFARSPANGANSEPTRNSTVA